MNLEKMSTRQIWVELSMGNITLDEFEEWIGAGKTDAYEAGYNDGQIVANQRGQNYDYTLGMPIQPLDTQWIQDLIKQLDPQTITGTGTTPATPSTQGDFFITSGDDLWSIPSSDSGSDNVTGDTTNQPKSSGPTTGNSNGIWFKKPDGINWSDPGTWTVQNLDNGDFKITYRSVHGHLRSRSK